MKRLLFTLIFCPLSLLAMWAQNPSWAKKSAAAVFTLKTFGADGSLLASANGFFIDEQGTAVSSFSPFKNAQRAVIIDAQGKEMPVDCLSGYNDMYDVAKFQVKPDKKMTALTVAQTEAANGTALWLMPYSVKKAPTCISGTVSSAEQFGEGYTYYTLAMDASDQYVGCPILNQQGEVVGILQPSADSKTSVAYAVSTRYASSLRMAALSFNDPVLRTVLLPKTLPDEQNEATLALFMGGSTMSPEAYSQLVDRYIQKFPQSNDGYVYRARLKVTKDDFQGADEDMRMAVSEGSVKDDAHYQYAQLIYQKNIYQSDKPYEPWTLDMALQESKAAASINPQPVYTQQQANILYAMQQYDAAYDLYMQLTQNEMMRAESFYAAAQCKTQKNDKQAALALLDSAVNTFSKPYVKTAAPYLFARAQANSIGRL